MVRLRLPDDAFPGQTGSTSTPRISRRSVPPKAKAKAATTPSGGRSTGRTLVIVESPAKAKTIAGYLGPDYDVEASVGHIRDLPKRAADIPAKYKSEAWSRLGVDVDNGYAALYVVDADKRTKVAELKKLLAGADTLLGGDGVAKGGGGCCRRRRRRTAAIAVEVA